MIHGTDRAALALAGRTADAASELASLIDASKTRYVSAFDIATIYAALGEAEKALHWLDRAIEQRSQPIMCLGVDPAFDALRAKPRFADVLARIDRGRD